MTKRTSDDLITRVIFLRVSKPDITLQEIANTVKLPISTVWDIVKKIKDIVPHSERLGSLVDRNNHLWSIADTLIEEMVLNKDDSITVAQLTWLRESTFKQNLLIEWDKKGKREINITWTI